MEIYNEPCLLKDNAVHETLHQNFSSKKLTAYKVIFASSLGTYAKEKRHRSYNMQQIGPDTEFP